MDYENGGILAPGVTYYQNTHPWKSDVIVPLNPTPEQLEQAALIVAFQDDIEMIDTSFLED
ncbi:hypothetical protein M2155_000551 [Streptomyces sp. SAI-119]|uniref:hypothetical protein n=1 Tax=Streptomyces sp. SAI-119 TaxID=2940541 RepID=UPI00247585AF|nr:hypothetical protein [Streptomyces sp. SAI-119]MDH6448143.1 hypothetical protein [Streptomyces sp. SAI-119]